MDEKDLERLREEFEHTDLSADIDAAEVDTRVVESPMVGITIRMKAEVLQEVREVASDEGIKTTALIRRWIEEALRSQERQSPAHKTQSSVFVSYFTRTSRDGLIKARYEVDAAAIRTRISS